MPEKKKSRREYGDGSIYRRKSDGRYVGSFRLANGSRKYVYGSTRNEAKKLLEEAQQLAASGALVASSSQKLADYLDNWLVIHRMTIKESSVQQYEMIVHRRIVPVLGKITMQKLARHQIQSFVNSLVGEGLTSAYVRNVFIVLREALSDAVKWKILAANPCADITLPRLQQKEAVVFQYEQVQQFLFALKGQAIEVLVIVALATATRRSELLALRWNDIDFEKKSVHIVRTLAYKIGVGFYETEPKTKSSRRTIALADFALVALREHQVKQNVTRTDAPSWPHPELVFPNARGGYFPFASLQQQFIRGLVQAGLSPQELHFHSLRHSSATFLLAQGVPPKVVQEILGHASIKTTMDRYGHVLPGMQKHAVDHLDVMFTESKHEEK